MTQPKGTYAAKQRQQHHRFRVMRGLELIDLALCRHEMAGLGTMEPPKWNSRQTRCVAALRNEINEALGTGKPVRTQTSLSGKRLLQQPQSPRS